MVDRRSAEQYEILTTKTNQDKSITYYEKRKKSKIRVSCCGSDSVGWSTYTVNSVEKKMALISHSTYFVFIKLPSLLKLTCQKQA